MDQRMITCDQKSSLHCVGKFHDPFINFKIEVMNNCAKKRKLDDASYETPAKKAFTPNSLSPDLGCFVDYCSPPTAQSVSSSAVSQSASISIETKDIASSQLHGECGSKPGGDEGTEPHSLKTEKVLFSLEPVFDIDVDAIMRLSPLSTAGEVSDSSEIGKNPNGSTSQDKRLSVPTVADGQELDSGHGDLVEVQELKKDIDGNVNDEEEDKGYFSMSYLKDCKIRTPKLLPTTSSPLLRIGEVKTAESSPESGCHALAAPHGLHVSFTVEGLSPTASGLSSNTVNSPTEPLEGDVEELWNIGQPIFESSVCHGVTVKVNTGSEQSRQVSEEVQGDVIESFECQTTFSGEETTLDTTYESTLPLQVQVKSVVVALSQLTSSKPVASSVPDQNTKLAKQSPVKNRSFRPLIFKREADWEREKSLYVASVTRHLKERSCEAPDVMTELMRLMTDVEDQTPGSTGRQWQHPSDLTCRNYQRRFGNMVPKMSLHEWQTKNSVKHKRFAHVSKIFERSPFP
ncbi:S100P-binding protein-like [Scomber scombrus]|uniref:S100P-binding protein n=1 Tax=Scomber scombrus TaxID=13677 RepID=A0AAV1P8W0_SCOSC